MFLIWSTLFVELVLLAIIKPFKSNMDIASILAISFHILTTSILLLGQKNKFKIIFFAGYLARLVFMVWDLSSDTTSLIGRTRIDAGGFYNDAINISNNISLLISDGRIGIFQKIFGLLFYFIGEQKIIAQYINVLFGLSVIVIIYKTLLLLDTSYKSIKKIILITAFFPNSLMMSAVFLREIIPTFFLALSLFYFVRWYRIAKTTDMFFSIILLAISCIFHSGLIGVLGGYSFAFMFYNHKVNKYKFNKRTILAFFMLIFIGFLSMTRFNDIFLRKIGSIENMDSIYSVANINWSSAGSAYLTDMKIENMSQFIFYSPIRAFYFLFSPLPMNWRGFADIITFFVDSLFYMCGFIIFIKNSRINTEHTRLSSALILAIIFTSIIFGIGVGTSGTALRHRQKIISLFLILFATKNEKVSEVK